MGSVNIYRSFLLLINRKRFNEILRARGIRPSPDLAPYLVLRIDRSVTAARDVVERLHEASARGHRPVTRALAREILEDETENLDLFDP